MNDETIRRGPGRPRKLPGVSVQADEAAEQAGEGSPQTAQVQSIRDDLKTETENKEMIELQSIIDSLTEKGGYVRIYQRGEYGAKKYLAEMEITSFSLEFVKNEFGGGDFRAEFLTSEKRFYKPFEFSIPSFFVGRIQKEAMPKVGNGQGVMIAHPPDNSPLLMQLMSQQKQESQMMFQAMMQMQMENTKGMFAMIGALFSGTNRRGPTEPASDILTAMMPLMLENMKPKTATGDVLDSVERLAKIKTLLADLGGEPAEKEDMFKELLKAIAPLGVQLLSKASAPIAPPMRPATIDAPPIAPMPAPAPQPPGAIQQLRMALPLLVNAAHKGSDPASYYDLVADNLDDQAFDQLIDILEKPDWCAVLFDNDARISQDPAVMQWLEQLRQLFLDSIEPPAAPNPDPNEPVQST